MIHIEIRNVELCGTVCPMVRQTQCHIERCVECPNLPDFDLDKTRESSIIGQIQEQQKHLAGRVG